MSTPSGAAAVPVNEIDLSTSVPQFPGAYGSMVIPALAGPVNQPQLITSPTQLLSVFTPNNTVEVGYDLSFYAALAFLQQSNNLWIMRVVDAALYGLIRVKEQGYGRPSYGISSVATFTVSSANATEGAVYTTGGESFAVTATVASATTLVTSFLGASPSGAGTLTKVSGTGDATITFSVVSASQGGLLNPSSFVFNSGSDPAVASIDLVTFAADSSDSLMGKYFTFGDVGSSLYCVNLTDTVNGGALGCQSVTTSNVTPLASTATVITTLFTTAQIATMKSGMSISGTGIPSSATISISTGIVTLSAATTATISSGAVIKLGATTALLTATPINVSFPENATAISMLSLVATAIDAADGGSEFTCNIIGASLQIIRNNAGVAAAAADGTSGYTTGFTFASQQTGAAIAGSAADDLFLIQAADPGAWANGVAVAITNYADNPVYVGVVGAFRIDVFAMGNYSTPQESWVCSRVQGAKDGYGNNIYIEDVLLGSQYINAIDNLAVSDTVLPESTILQVFMNGGFDGNAITDGDMISGLQNFSNPDNIFVTLVMDGGWATPAYQTAIISLAESRKDCVGLLGVPYSDEASNQYLNNVLAYRKSTLNANTSYASMYSPAPKIYDQYNDRFIYVSATGYAGAVISYTASNFEIWYPAAGFTRGIINVLDLRVRYDLAEQGELYDNGINPLRFAPGRGILIWGQKTLLSQPSLLNRLNVRLLLIVIEPAIKAALENFLFDLNDAATQTLAAAMVSSYMDGIKAQRGVYAYQVTCDSTNNSPDDVDNHIMNLWLFIQPTPSLEYIPFTVIITNQGISFALAAQQL